MNTLQHSNQVNNINNSTVKTPGDNSPVVKTIKDRSDEFINLAKAAGLYWKDGQWRSVNKPNNNTSPSTYSFKGRKIDYSVLTRTFKNIPVEFDSNNNVIPVELGRQKGVGRGRGRRANSIKITFPDGNFTINQVAKLNNLPDKEKYRVNNELKRLEKEGLKTKVVGFVEKTGKGKKERIMQFIKSGESTEPEVNSVKNKDNKNENPVPSKDKVTIKPNSTKTKSKNVGPYKKWKKQKNKLKIKAIKKKIVSAGKIKSKVLKPTAKAKRVKSLVKSKVKPKPAKNKKIVKQVKKVLKKKKK